MPIYEFRCEKCANVFEHLAMSQNDGFKAKCPACGGEELSRVMSACNSVVTGSSPSSAPQPSGMQVDNRSCKGAGSCTSITLPGLDS